MLNYKKYLSLLEQHAVLKQRLSCIEENLSFIQESIGKVTYEVMFCPACSKQHIDEGEFATRLHHTHRCVTDTMGVGCEFEWREEEYKFGIR